MVKIRLDVLLCNRDLAESREKARALILAGEVRVNGKIIDKPGASIEDKAEIDINSSVPRYVSRGGFKLEKAIEEFSISLKNRIVLDVGASTGGFTDCALQYGAAQVWAVDVGYGQLHWKLRNDPRVVVLEKTNIRYLKREEINTLFDIVTVDVSFISVFKVFPVVKQLLKRDGHIISLIKPQFEAGRDKIGKNGVVRDSAIHREVLVNCIAQAAHQGLQCINATFSPITGPKGNIEFFLHLSPGAGVLTDREITNLVDNTVKAAHEQLGGSKN
ncbi:MAG: TlyA family RNA methyltransferase [Syntrophomonadaceae bacterium]